MLQILWSLEQLKQLKQIVGSHNVIQQWTRFTRPRLYLLQPSKLSEARHE